MKITKDANADFLCTFCRSNACRYTFSSGEASINLCRTCKEMAQEQLNSVK